MLDHMYWHHTTCLSEATGLQKFCLSIVLGDFLANQHIKTMEKHPGKHNQALIIHISKTRRKICHVKVTVSWFF